MRRAVIERFVRLVGAVGLVCAALLVLPALGAPAPASASVATPANPLVWSAATSVDPSQSVLNGLSLVFLRVDHLLHGRRKRRFHVERLVMVVTVDPRFGGRSERRLVPVDDLLRGRRPARQRSDLERNLVVLAVDH